MNSQQELLLSNRTAQRLGNLVLLELERLHAVTTTDEGRTYIEAAQEAVRMHIAAESAAADRREGAHGAG